VPPSSNPTIFMASVEAFPRQSSGATQGWVSAQLNCSATQQALCANLRIQDLCAAIISDGDHSTVLPLQHWIPSNVSSAEVHELFCSEETPDMWANYAVYLAAKVCHFIWCKTKSMDEATLHSEQSSFQNDWHDLWTEVQAWRQNRPAELLELDFPEECGESASSPFPSVLFAASCAISSNQLHHTACLLMLDIKPPSIELSNADSTSSSLWHARRICGISATNEHHGCLNNAIQP